MAIGIFILCGMTIQYYRDPHVYATIDDENNLFLSNGEKIEPFDILHCRYEKARNRYYHFSYGRIVLETKKGTFVFKYVEECEKIYDKIMKMMYEAKQEEKKNIDENFENSIKM